MILQQLTYPYTLELHPHGRTILSYNFVDPPGDQAKSCLELELEDVTGYDRNENSNCFSSGDNVVSSAIRSVRFSTSPSLVYEYLHVNDITLDEKSLTWWSPNRLRNTRLVSQQRRKRIRSTRWLVLSEQERQRRLGMNNPFLISC